MANKLVTVGEGDAAYSVVMDVEETPDKETPDVDYEATFADTHVARLSHEDAEKYTKAQLVDYVALAEEDDSGGTEDA